LEKGGPHKPSNIVDLPTTVTGSLETYLGQKNLRAKLVGETRRDRVGAIEKAARYTGG